MDILKRIFTGEVKGIEEKERTITAYVSTKARDRMDEVLMPDGADLTKFRKNPVVLWAHDYTVPPIGKALWIKKDGNGILSKFKFASTAFADEIFSLYKDGIMNAFSVGFIPKEFEDGDGEKKPRRTYSKWEMLEFSAVPVPANPEALSLAISKGLLKDANLIKQFEAKEEIIPDLTEDFKEVEEPKEEIKIKDVSSELIAEIDLLKKEIENLKKTITDIKGENCDLRFKLNFVGKDTGKDLVDITELDLLKKIEEVAVRVISKAKGKV